MSKKGPPVVGLTEESRKAAGRTAAGLLGTVSRLFQDAHPRR
jgi:hypothetical protein